MHDKNENSRKGWGELLFDGVQLPGHVILYPVGVPPLDGIDKEPADQHPIVEVISARQSGLAGQCNDIALGDGLPRFYGDAAEVAVGGSQSLAVVNDHG